MENNNEKRMAGCWEILHALHIGDKEVVVGENLTAPNEARYMCAYCTANDIMRGYNECMASDDYLEIMELYTERITGQIEAVKAEIAERQLPDMTISADQCHKNDFSKSIVGKIVAIRADALRREYDTFSKVFKLTLKGTLSHTIDLGSDIHGNIQRMENAFDMFPTRLNACEQALANIQTQIENAKAEAEKPFAQEDELRTKSARLAELDAMLNMDKRENNTLDAAPEQEEERTKRRSEPEYER